MSKISKKLNSLTVPALVTEMSDKVDGFNVAVPFAQGVNVDELTTGDNDPLFVTVEVLSPQVSANKRHWTEDSLYEVAEQINLLKPDAYQGHIKEDERPFASPNSQTIWLGSVVKKVRGTARLFAKGYVLPYADKLKSYLRASKASGKKVGVSVYGKANQVWNNVKQAYDVSNFQLESIDWARAGSEGVKGTGYLALTSEMKGENSMDRQEVIQTITLDELKANNPTLVKEMQEEAEQQAADDQKKKEEEEAAKKAEEEANKGGDGGDAGEKEDVQEMVQVRETLGAEKGKTVEVVSEMKTELDAANKRLADNFVEKALSEKISNTDIASFTKKLVVAEMENMNVTADDLKSDDFKGLIPSEIKAKKAITAVLSSPEAKSLISEMSRSTVISPVADNRNKPESKRQFTVIK